MNTIYRPTGRAREYSPWALNIYHGCEHRCSYCYMRGRIPVKAEPRKGLHEELEKFLSKNVIREQVLLCFSGDPYCAEEAEFRWTRSALQVLREFGPVPVAILTKGGTRALGDLDLFLRFGDRIKVGATLTFATDVDTKIWEPGAAGPGDRFWMLRYLHEAGARTWASLEPVIDPLQSLRLIERSAEYVDEYRVGRWNHDGQADRIDWAWFGKRAVDLLRELGKPFYVKQDLRAFLPEGYLSEAEADCNALNLRVDKVDAVDMVDLVNGEEG